MMETKRTILNVSSEDISKRVDTYLTEKLSKFSRSYFKGLIENKHVNVNNRIIAKSSYSLKLHDVIEVCFPTYEAVEISEVDKDLGVKIIYEHHDFLIVYKPANLIVHKPCSKSKDVTLVDWLIYNFKEVIKVGSIDRPGIVHRLDKDTSGILIIAKTNYAHMKFGAMFKERTIAKTYFAVVEGHPPLRGIIDEKISRDPLYRNKMSAKYDHGRDSLTHYKVITYLKNSALVQVNPVTGRTHQIRVHFAAIGHSLIGDTLYGDSSKLIDRQALHAQRLSFIYEGVNYVIWVNLPKDMTELINKLDLTS